jgi:spermidine synthase
VKFVYREQTPFNDLRIYDTEQHGRILWLNGYLQVTKQFLESGYREALCKPLLQNENILTHLNSVVVLGGGDLLIVEFLLQRVPQIQKIIVVDIDKNVTAAILKYFTFAQHLEEEVKSGRLELVYEDGAEWVKKMLQ